MALEIIYRFGTFELQGNFTKENAPVVKEKFNHALDQYAEVIMCLKKVNQIDTSGIEVLKAIYKKADKRSKVLFVLGKDNQCINPVFERTQTTHLFRNDY